MPFNTSFNIIVPTIQIKQFLIWFLYCLEKYSHVWIVVHINFSEGRLLKDHSLISCYTLPGFSSLHIVNDKEFKMKPTFNLLFISLSHVLPAMLVLLLLSFLSSLFILDIKPLSDKCFENMVSYTVGWLFVECFPKLLGLK